ncbi:Hint domain-containing protein [Sulfitobacter sp. PS-8MA]|uniref:Hint domain-containing protein n=1 Tax=Sulfitobacter sp. PS-8MA TaxID=3237707 RepID=UPI0034C67161
MKTGFRGTFVIGWSQTEIDGQEAAPVSALEVGAAWAWRGDVIRVDGPTDVLRLDRADGAAELRRRAAGRVQRLIGAALEETDHVPPDPPVVHDDSPLMDNSFLVTDGVCSYTVTLIDPGCGRQPLLMFIDEMPPRHTELWVVHHRLGRRPEAHLAPAGAAAGVICFTPGTRIRTPRGFALIEDLREGDLIQTKDNGSQPIAWIGSRQMTGARFHAMPHLRPVRFRAGALGQMIPDGGLLVSPEHRILLGGAKAREMFNTDEVLVAAKDLVNDSTVTVDAGLRGMTYIHVMLDRHQVIWANSVETESFHPASAPLEALAATDRARLLAASPDLGSDPHLYGGFARRTLSTPEAAILQQVA